MNIEVFISILYLGVMQMAIVKEYKMGKTTIKFDDDAYKDKTPEELELIHKQIANVCWRIALEARAKGKDI